MSIEHVSNTGLTYYLIGYGADGRARTLPEEVRSAYTVLEQEARLGSDGEGADPGADREPFDPEARCEAAQEEAAIPFDQPYDFQGGRIYHLESSHYICKLLDGASGAPSDIAHPEVGHVLWSAALGVPLRG